MYVYIVFKLENIQSSQPQTSTAKLLTFSMFFKNIGNLISLYVYTLTIRLILNLPFSTKALP